MPASPIRRLVPFADQARARDEARAAKDWAAADQIRDEITARGVVLEDTPTGTRWKVVG